MKTTSIFLVCMMLARVAMAQFEGVIEMKVTSLNSDGQPEMTVTATNSIKGTSMLIETLTNVGGVTMKQVTLVRGQEPNKIYMLDREKKTYTEMDLSGMVEGINRQQEEYEVKKMAMKRFKAITVCMYK